MRHFLAGVVLPSALAAQAVVFWPDADGFLGFMGAFLLSLLSLAWFCMAMFSMANDQYFLAWEKHIQKIAAAPSFEARMSALYVNEAIFSQSKRSHEEISADMMRFFRYSAEIDDAFKSVARMNRLQ